MSDFVEAPARALAGVDRRPTAFSVTCSLLSRYVKEKRGSIAAAAAWTLDPGKSEGIRTLSFLPSAGDASSGEGDDRSADLELFPHPAREPAKAAPQQLTMFYGGKVVVFDDFPREKARDLIDHLAGKNLGVAGRNPPPSQLLRVSQPTSSDMPIARSASLHRFLQKRKERVTAMCPYDKPIGGSSSGGSPAAAAAKPEEEEGGAWLGLGTGGLVKQELLNSGT